MKRTFLICVALALMLAQVVQASPNSRPVPKGSKFRPLATSSVTAAARGDQSGLQDQKTPSKLECRASGDPSANVLLDCDGITPNNEPHMIVDPTDPQHMVGSSNDYQSCCDEFYTTFDGGQTWRTGNMSVEAPGKRARTGSDPVTAFDVKHGTVIHSSLNFNNDGSDGDVVVSLSQDGGLHWTNVTKNIPNLPPWGTVWSVAPSRFDAATAYVVVNLQHQADYDARVYKTSDYGASWKLISAGVPTLTGSSNGEWRRRHIASTLSST